MTKIAEAGDLSHHPKSSAPQTQIAAKLELMRWRSGIFWTLAGSFALAVILAFAATPTAFAGGAAAGMSAPSAPATSIEAARAAKLLQPQFDWHGAALRPSG